MRPILFIAAREARDWFMRPRTYLLLAGFVVAQTALALRFDDWLGLGVASLRRPLWTALLCLVPFVPALTLRSFADGQVLQVLPLSDTAVVVGKWLATFCVVTVAVAMLLPYAAALVLLSEPDLGSMLGGLFGVWLAAGALAAVGIAASAHTDSAAAAYLVPFVLGALPLFAALVMPALSATVVSWVEAVSPAAHFHTLTTGLLQGASVSLFVGITAVSLRVGIAARALDRLS